MLGVFGVLFGSSMSFGTKRTPSPRHPFERRARRVAATTVPPTRSCITGATEVDRCTEHSIAEFGS